MIGFAFIILVGLLLAGFPLARAGADRLAGILKHRVEASKSCPACAYDRAHLTDEQKCPECGLNRNTAIVDRFQRTRSPLLFALTLGPLCFLIFAVLFQKLTFGTSVWLCISMTTPFLCVALALHGSKIREHKPVCFKLVPACDSPILFGTWLLFHKTASGVPFDPSFSLMANLIIISQISILVLSIVGLWGTALICALVAESLSLSEAAG